MKPRNVAIASGLALALACSGTAVASVVTQPQACAQLHVASGNESLDHWTRVNHHSVSEVITASLACHSYVWPRGLVRYIDAGFLHYPMPKGMKFYTVNGS